MIRWEIVYNITVDAMYLGFSGNCPRFCEIIIFFIVVAICDLVHDMTMVNNKLKYSPRHIVH